MLFCTGQVKHSAKGRQGIRQDIRLSWGGKCSTSPRASACTIQPQRKHGEGSFCRRVDKYVTVALSQGFLLTVPARCEIPVCGIQFVQYPTLPMLYGSISTQYSTFSSAARQDYERPWKQAFRSNQCTGTNGMSHTTFALLLYNHHLKLFLDRMPFVDRV